MACLRTHNGKMDGDRALATAALATASDDDHSVSHPFPEHCFDIEERFLQNLSDSFSISQRYPCSCQRIPVLRVMVQRKTSLIPEYFSISFRYLIVIITAVFKYFFNIVIASYNGPAKNQAAIAPYV